MSADSETYQDSEARSRPKVSISDLPPGTDPDSDSGTDPDSGSGTDQGSETSSDLLLEIDPGSDSGREDDPGSESNLDFSIPELIPEVQVAYSFSTEFSAAASLLDVNKG